MLRWIEINCIEKAKKWSLTWTRWRNERIIVRSSYFFLFLPLSKETSYLRRKKPIYKTESIISRPGFTSTPFQFSFVSTIDGLYGRISKGNWFPSRMKIISIWLSKTYVMNRNDRYQLFLLTLICLFPFSPPCPLYLLTLFSRTDLSEVLESQLKTDVMLVAGSLASHLHTVRTMANHLNKTKSTLVLIDGVGDVLNEAVSWPSLLRNFFVVCCVSNCIRWPLTLLTCFPDRRTIYLTRIGVSS